MSPCPDCDVDLAEWDDQDTRTTLASVDALWSALLRDLPGAAELTADLRPSPDADPSVATADALHTALHGFRLAGRRLAEQGLLGTGGIGTVVAINASGGGVPKTSLDDVEVGRRGLVGDTQRNRLHHGRPFQAVSLWSAEVIEALQAEGHPVEAGLAGENLTLAGLDWAAVRPGQRLQVGTVLLELSSWAVPCRHLAPYFAGGDFRRINADDRPGWSRAYAFVVSPGHVTRGDAAVLLP